MRVVVGASSFAVKSSKPVDILKNKGIEVIKNPYGRKMTESEIIEHLQGADGILAGLEPLNENVLSKAQSLKAIARIGIGMDNVDVEAAKKYGIKVSNTPDAPTKAVAEMTITMLLAIGHQIIESNRDIHNGIWKKRIGFSVEGLNVLVIGYGRIGKLVSEHLRYFRSNIFIYDPNIPEISIKSLCEAVKRADVITIHAAGKEEILTYELFKQMKEGMVILNSARGSLINEDALYDALNNGIVSYFWGDALWNEPYEGKLIKCDNAILTPHISTYNFLCRRMMETEAVENILKDLGYVQ